MENRFNKALTGFIDRIRNKPEEIDYDPDGKVFGGKRWPVYLIAFGLPMLIMLLVFAALSIFPFGNASVLVLDLNGQYVYFFEELRAKILGDGSFMYSWGRSLGGEFMGIFAYYIASPFSFLVVLFPKENITEALMVMFLLKTGCCGLTMSVFLQRKMPTKSVNNIIFSAMYALCSYAVVYMHNTMWIDEMIFLPLLVLGIERLVTKRKPFMFVGALAFSCMTNFYIGYMMCIFTAIYYVYYICANPSEVTNPDGIRYHLAKTTLRMVLYSAIALAISALIILPAYTGLQFGKSDFTNPNYNFSQRFDFLDLIAKMYPGAYDSVTPSGLPWVYSGTLTIILLPLYFLCKKISVREKVATGLLILVLVLSFNGSTIDIFWHGMQKPNWLNYRYSFMLIFIIILCAYKVFCNLRSFDYHYILCSVGALTILLFIIQKFNYAWLSDLPVVWASLGFLAAYAIALHPVSKRYMKQYIRPVILILVSLELFSTSLMYTTSLNSEVGSSRRTAYRNYIDTLQPIVDNIKQYDADTFGSAFYRMEKDTFKKTNDNLALGMYGVSLSSSMLNKNVISTLARMGYDSMSHWTKYYGGTPVADSILGIKYLIKGSEYNDLLYEQIYEDDDESYYGYYNPYNLGLAFAVDKKIDEFSGKAYDTPFEYLNALVTYMLGEDETIELFKEVNYSDIQENLDISYSGGNRMYTKINSSRDARITFSLEPVGNNETFCFFPTTNKKVVNLSLNGVDIGTFFENDTYCVTSLGILKGGENSTLTMTLKDSSVYMQSNVHYFYYLDHELFKEVMVKLRDGVYDISYFDDTRIDGKITVAGEGKTVFTSIPYDSGWKVYVDDTLTELNKFDETLISFDITEGEHTISFVYYPDCVKYGVIISLTGIIALAGTVVAKKLYGSSRRKNKKVEKTPDDDDLMIEEIISEM